MGKRERTRTVVSEPKEVIWGFHQHYLAVMKLEFGVAPRLDTRPCFLGFLMTLSVTYNQIEFSLVNKNNVPTRNQSPCIQ